MRFDMLLRKLLLGLITILGAMTIVFIVIRVVPGDPASLMLGDESELIPEEYVEIIRTQLGIDKPIWQQYFIFIKSIFTGSLGVSYRTGEGVSSMIAARFPDTVELAFGGFLVATLIGIPSGIIAALKHNSLIDRAMILLTSFGLSAPAFWIGLVLLYFFSFRWGWFPIVGFKTDGTILDRAYVLVLPSVTLGLRSAALLSRVTRSSMLEAMGQNYISTARAKGMLERIVIFRHAFINAMLPVVTLLGVNVAYLLGGSVIVEVVFTRQGMGRLLIESIFSRDYAVVQGAIIMISFVTVGANLFVDLLYGVIDPRLRTA